MARPGFYNDNEHRAYPFIYRSRTETLPTIAEELIIDAGFIMGLDADFDATRHSIWLHTISKTGNTLQIAFKTDSEIVHALDDAGFGSVLLVFTRDLDSVSKEWATSFEIADWPDNVPAVLRSICAVEPLWEGFLVTGRLDHIASLFAGDEVLTYAKNEYQIEPARIQNLAKSYLRSISVGNYERTKIPKCDATLEPPLRQIVPNAICLAGDVKLKEGYHCDITQNTRRNTINISAAITAGAEYDAAFCETGSELPLITNEELPEDQKFYSASPACDELIFTINGVGGKNVTLFSGNGIIIETIDGNKIKLTAVPNAANACPPADEPPL